MTYTIEQAALKMAHLAALSRNEPFQADIGTVVETDSTGRVTLYSAVNTLNKNGYIPFISTIVGCVRILENLIDMVHTIAMGLFGHPTTTAENALFHAIQIGRGSLELVPVLGNGILYIIDRIRISILENKIIQTQELKPDIRYYFSNGRLISCGIKGTYESDFTFMYYGGARFV